MQMQHFPPYTSWLFVLKVLIEGWNNHIDIFMLSEKDCTHVLYQCSDFIPHSAVYIKVHELAVVNNFFRDHLFTYFSLNKS